LSCHRPSAIGRESGVCLGDFEVDGQTGQRNAEPGGNSGTSRSYDGEQRLQQLAAARRLSALCGRIGAGGQRQPHQGLHDRRRSAPARCQVRSATRSDRARRGDQAAPHHRPLLCRAWRRRHYPHRSAARQLCADVQAACGRLRRADTLARAGASRSPAVDSSAAGVVRLDHCHRHHRRGFGGGRDGGPSRRPK
jgi:hypothetical protein